MLDILRLWILFALFLYCSHQPAAIANIMKTNLNLVIDVWNDDTALSAKQICFAMDFMHTFHLFICSFYSVMPSFHLIMHSFYSVMCSFHSFMRSSHSVRRSLHSTMCSFQSVMGFLIWFCTFFILLYGVCKLIQIILKILRIIFRFQWKQETPTNIFIYACMSIKP